MAHVLFDLPARHPGAGLYALPDADVLQIVPTPPLVPVPFAPDALLGLMNVNARLVAALDLGRLLGLPGPAQLGPHCVLLGRLRKHTSPLALMIGAVRTRIDWDSLPVPADAPEGGWRLWQGERVDVLASETLARKFDQICVPALVRSDWQEG